MKTTKTILITVICLFIFACGSTDKRGGTSHVTDDVEEADYIEVSEETSDKVKKDARSEGESVEKAVDVEVDVESDPSPEPATNNSGLLTAGEWNDLSNWDFWNNLMDTANWANMMNVWKFSLESRVPVVVKDKSGNLLNNITVQLQDSQNNTVWTAKTDVFGKAELWANIFGGQNQNFKLIVKDNSGNKQVFPNIKASEQENILTFDGEQNTSNNIDLMFVVDATGSMGDELEYLKNEINNIINTVNTEVAGTNIRVSLVFYRDEGDEYNVKDFGFETNIKKVEKNIAKQSADGGDDFPEAVDDALENGILEQKWNENAKTRLLFLILDAPPHQESKNITKMQTATKKASEKGIKIIPVVASGIDKETEFLMRFIACATNGTYVFLTDDSGIGESHLKPTVGKYEVEMLNDLIIRLILKYSGNVEI